MSAIEVLAWPTRYIRGARCHAVSTAFESNRERGFVRGAHLRRTVFALGPIAAVILGTSGAVAAGLLPQGGHFTSGQGSINKQPSSLGVTQTSARGVIDWSSFSIGSGNSVAINNGTGATLSRVSNSGASIIDGKLSATGSLYLINPQGIVIGSGGVVTTGGRFVASTLVVAPGPFMAGGDISFAGGGNGSVVNLGKISSTGGDVLLISRTLVQNDGSISAPKGSAELVTGDQVLLHDSTSAPQTYVQATTAGNVYNTGHIAAAQIALQAADGNVFALAGTNTTLRATGTTTRDGHVWLVAPKGTAHMHSRIDAANADGSGGIVDTASKAVHLDDLDVHAAQWNLNTPAINVGPLTAAILKKQLSQGTSIAIDATSGDINIAGLGWTGGTSLALNAHGSVTIVPGATLGNKGAGNLTLRADADGIDNGGSVTNRGAIDWSKSTGTVSALYDMSGKWSPGTTRTNQVWIAAPFSGLVTQVTAYKLVNSPADMNQIAGDLSGTYALGKDIDFRNEPAGSGLSDSSTTFFAGQFDGMNHVIRNISLDASANPDQGYLGIFNTIDSLGVVRNLNIEYAGVMTTAQNSPVEVGILAGSNFGLITNVHTSGTIDVHSNGFNTANAGGLVGVNVGLVERSSSSAQVKVDTYANAGGLVADNTEGSIVQSFASGSVSGGDHSRAGGLTENNLDNGTITQSYSTASVSAPTAGGLLAINLGKISESFASGSVSSPAAGAISNYNYASIASDVFWDAQKTGVGNGTFQGTGLPAANALTTAQMSIASSFGPTWNFGAGGVWAMPAGATHPVLRWELAKQ